MRTVAIWSGVSAVVMVVIAMQLGVQHQRRTQSDQVPSAGAPAEAPAKPASVFPDDLAPAARALPVPAAAEFKPSTDVHPLVYLQLNGSLHPWQETLHSDWAADSVTTTELAVVLGVPRKASISHHTYPNGAPPITRYQFELELSVIEAKTGKILANRLFRNVPRPIMKVESWETTAIGRAVTQEQVFAWVGRMCKKGFPESGDQRLIVTQMD
jgi:hypothetical protein